MANYFISNSIFTNYGLNRINSIVKGNYNNINISKIKIGDGNGNSITLDPPINNMVNPVYNFDITETILSSNTVTFIATIPNYVQDFRIREIGIFETLNGVDNLFAVASVNSYKPSDLSYLLIIQVKNNFIFENVDYSSIKFGINSPIYINQEDLDVYINDYLLKIEENLSRVIHANYLKLTDGRLDGYFTEQYQQQYDWINYSSISSSCKLDKFIGSDNNIILDCYFNSANKRIYYPDIYSVPSMVILENMASLQAIDTDYVVRDFSIFSNFITVSSSNNWSSNSNIILNDGINDYPITIRLKGAFNDISDQVLLKIDGCVSLYISNNTLYFKLISNSGFYSCQYYLADLNVNSESIIAITYNGNKNNPNVEIYHDKIKVTGVKVNSSYAGLLSNGGILQNYESFANNSYYLLSKFKYGSVSIIKQELTHNQVNYLV